MTIVRSYIEVKSSGGMVYYKDVDRGIYYRNEPVIPGDTVEYVGTRSGTYQKGDTREVFSVERGSYTDSVFMDGGYNYPYVQTFMLEGDSTRRSMKNWRKVGANKKGSTVLALEVNKPTYVVEIQRTAVDGKQVVTEVGPSVEFDSRSAARVYAGNEITKNIREHNLYKEYRIYQEVDLVRAKQPEIEFA